MKQIIINLTQLTEPILKIEIDEPTEILGLFIGTGNDSCQFRLEVIHKQPQLSSLTLIKAVLFDQAQFDFEGDIIIKTGAKYTDSYLKAAVLMLSRQAKARAVPALEIMENDVKGGHGATVGRVDEEELFYLSSRGLSRTEATRVLVNGFLRDLIDRVTDQAQLTKLSQYLKKLPDEPSK